MLGFLKIGQKWCRTPTASVPIFGITLKLTVPGLHLSNTAKLLYYVYCSDHDISSTEKHRYTHFTIHVNKTLTLKTSRLLNSLTSTSHISEAYKLSLDVALRTNHTSI